jgi:PleD family two-component response regulator
MDAAGIPVSVGTANLRPGESAESLHLEADAALYAAKRGRRSYERATAG